MQLTKAYVAETSCRNLSLIESATYMLIKINSLNINNIAMSLYDITLPGGGNAVAHLIKVAICKHHYLCIEVHPRVQNTSVGGEEQEQPHGDETQQGHEKVPDDRQQKAGRLQQ